MYQSRTLVALCRLTMAVTLLSGCAAFQPPARPLYTGVDNVSIADSEQIVGTWTVVELNPLPDAPVQTTTIEYMANGKVTGYVKSLEGDPVLPVGFTMTLTGDWTLEGDVVTHTNMTIAGPDDSLFSQLLAETLNSQPKLESRANIMEVEADRIVMIGRDGAAMEYRRQ